jgi:uncharacterized protein (DUF58 family)
VSTASIDWAAVRAAAVRLAFPRTPISGRLGERLGAGIGSSLEFQDYRSYAPGDDLRHVDWAAYARSEVLAVRMYREEVAPRVDLIVDTSRSMAVDDRKLLAHMELCGLIAYAGVSSAAETVVLTGRDPEPLRLRRAEDIARVLQCDAVTSALEGSHLPLRRRSMRIVVSDFLFPHDPDTLVSRLARDSASLAMIQLTLPEEAHPLSQGGRRLIDVEGRGEMDLVIDAAAVEAYRARFSRLRLGLARAARRAGARFTHIVSGTPLRGVARSLAAAGIVEPA